MAGSLPLQSFRTLFTSTNHSIQFWKKNETAADDGSAMTVPDEWLNADIRQGITASEVESRRKKFGWNEITTDKENLFLKFLGFFTGPILYGKLPTPSVHHPISSATCNGSISPLAFSPLAQQLPRWSLQLELRSQKAWHTLHTTQCLHER
jgi:magnesium-transporting ATPase (P-type)